MTEPSIEREEGATPTRRFDAVLFDLGDTLVDFGAVDVPAMFEEAARSTYNHLSAGKPGMPDYQTYRDKHMRAMKRSALWAKLTGGELNSAHVLERVARKLGFYEDSTLMGELAWLWYQPLHKIARVKDDVKPTLEALQKSGFKLGLISNTFISGKVHDRHLAELGLLEFFPVRRYSCDFGRKKPDVRIFTSALAELNVSADRALFVGDLISTDMVGGRRAGMTTALKRDGAVDAGDRKWVDHVVPTIGAVLGVVGVGS